MKTNITKQEKDVLMGMVKASVSDNEAIRTKAYAELTQALTSPFREAVFDGDILFDIFEKIDTPGDSTPKFDLHYVTPGTEHEFSAYTIPKCGAIPYRSVQGDEVMIHTYKVGNSIDACLDLIERARYDIVEDMFMAYRNGFVQLMNRDGWRTILKAAKARNVIVSDPDARQGELSKRLISLMMSFMERNGGGNSMSTNGGKLTDLYMSTEAMANIRNWNVDQLDEITRREIHESGGRLSRLFGVNLHSLRELGVGQEFNNYLLADGAVLPTNGTPPHTDVEFVVGLDLSGNRSFVMPVSKEVETFYDPYLHRMQRWGIYGWTNLGFGVMDTRTTVLGSL